MQSLPVHYEIGGMQRAFSTTAIVLAVIAWGTLAWRIVMQVDLARWWVPLAVIGGLLAADFGSGIVHWAADTWGRDDLPLIGKWLLVPFRVHHINPDDFSRRSFVDTNGEVAAIVFVALTGLLVMPLAGGTAPVAIFGLACCGLGMMTNQIHQWAHLPAVPAPVRVLQRVGILLGRDAHAIHHQSPYNARYCITTGWCNRPLDAIEFFRRTEGMITRLTGLVPRADDERYVTRYGRRHGCA